jgi:protein-S-isoprenylcysteine O-methyltransferase Ste14
VNIRIPPPLQTLIAAGIMYGLDTLISVSLYRFGLLAGIVMAVLGLASVFFLMPAVFSFWKNKTTVNPIKPENATTLVVDGVYKYSRNPMYVGMAAQLLAWAVYLANPFNFLVFALYVYVMTAIQIKPEERALVKIFGASYREYCEQVRRWV